jgi:quinohemoprotein ethanol dehydrogenase
MILADIEFDGKPRKVIMQAPKNGFFYVIDRVSGELLSAEKYTTVTWADRVDLKTGRPVITAQSDFSDGPKLIWPSQAGGHNWPPMAYNAEEGLVYIPVLEAPMTFEMHDKQDYRPFSIVQGVGGSFPALADPNDPALVKLVQGQPKPKFEQVLKAWNPKTGKIEWASKIMPFWSGGVMTTSSGLVVQGSSDGHLTFYDAKSGAVLHRINIGTGIMAAPMAYEVDGTQYIAVAAGFGGAFNSFFKEGWAAKTRENNARLLVFKLGGDKVRMAGPRPTRPLTAAPAKFRGSAAQVERGATLYVQNCARCHAGPEESGSYPNLWKMTPETHEAFNNIVLGGAFAYAGMASFSDVLSPTDARDIHAFLAKPLESKAPDNQKPAAERKSLH